MSIQSIGANNSLNAIQLSNQISNTVANVDSDGDHDGSRTSRTGGGGKLASAVEQALVQLGASSGTSTGASATSGTSGTSSAQDPQQALSSFMQNLFAALHGQANQQPGSSNPTSGSGESSANAVAGAGEGHHHHHHGGGMGKLESGLQNLIQQLSSSSGSDTSGSSTSDSGSGSSNSALDALQQSFNNLLSADGISGDNATLKNFLQTLSQHFQGAQMAGNVVATKA